MCEASDRLHAKICRLLPNGLHCRDDSTVDLGPDWPPLGSSRSVSTACVAGSDLQSPPVASLGDQAHQRPQTQVCNIIMRDNCTPRRSSSTVQQGTHKASLLQCCAPSDLYIDYLHCCMSADMAGLYSHTTVTLQTTDFTVSENQRLQPNPTKACAKPHTSKPS